MPAKGTLHIPAITLLIAFSLIAIYNDNKISIINHLSFFFLLLTLFFLIFFRDPERKIAEGIVSPADGKIIKIQEEKEIKISIFMNLHDVHVNRIPISGKVISMIYIKGSHLPAFNKNSERNERMITTLQTEIGEVKITQIAGIFARRIKPYIKEGQVINKGERMGIIMFGSRVILQMPNKVKIKIKEGDRVLAGSTSIGDIL